MTTSCTTGPMACCLAAGAHKARIAWIEDLAKRALRSHARSDLTLYLCYAPEASSEVQELVEQERQCCPFLTFDLLQSGEACCLTITAPEAASESASMLFEHFLADRTSTQEPSRVLAQVQPG